MYTDQHSSHETSSAYNYLHNQSIYVNRQTNHYTQSANKLRPTYTWSFVGLILEVRLTILAQTNHSISTHENLHLNN